MELHSTKPRPYGHYFILEKIAQGGMAEIFKGLTYDFSGLKKFIVIKRILPHIAANPEFIRMLVDEAKIAVRLSHGNIAQTLDLGKVADDYFIVMEYVAGHTISEFFKCSLQRSEPIPIPIAVHVVGEVCQGLDYMHRRRDEKGQLLGIIHCDISPQNIIVTESGLAKIVDFGVAKVAWQLSEGDSGVLKGKFAYMSPEQISGDPVSTTTDIFSTGIMLWETLTGERLFKRKLKNETMKAVCFHPIAPPSQLRPEIPPELDRIVLKALERDPAQRYASAADMALELTKFQLRFFPEFKATQIGQLIQGWFPTLDATGELDIEKTQFDTPELSGETATDQVEDTQRIDPKELDFQSVFDDIHLEEASEVTNSVPIEDWDERAMVTSVDSPLPNEVLEEATDAFVERPPTEAAQPPERSWKRLGISVLVVVLCLILFIVMFFALRP